MKKILIVGSNFYKDIFKKQIKILEKNLKKNNIKFDKISVPGIFEIPYKISKNLNKYKGFLAIGCAIKCKTDHYDLITNATFISLSYLSIVGKKPIGNGIITAKNKNQASERIISKSKEAFKVIKTLL